MKISVIIGGVLVFVVVIIYLMFGSDNNAERKPVGEVLYSGLSIEESGNTEDGAQQDSGAQFVEGSHENRRSDMLAAFAKLEKSRKQLKSQANLLKSKIWGLELPAEQANTVSKKMRQVYAYLKNPQLLGAYFELDEIHIEIRQVEAMREGLNEAERLITSSQNSGN